MHKEFIITLELVVSTDVVGPLDNLDIDGDEAGTATPTIAGAAAELLLVLAPLGIEGRSGAGGIGLKGGMVEPLGVGAAFDGVLTTIGLPFKKIWSKFCRYYTSYTKISGCSVQPVSVPN